MEKEEAPKLEPQLEPAPHPSPLEPAQEAAEKAPELETKKLRLTSKVPPPSPAQEEVKELEPPSPRALEAPPFPAVAPPQPQPPSLAGVRGWQRPGWWVPPQLQAPPVQPQQIIIGTIEEFEGLMTGYISLLIHYIT